MYNHRGSDREHSKARRISQITYKFTRLTSISSIAIAISACKPDESKVRDYIPDKFIDASIEYSVRVPFLCASAIFFRPLNESELSDIPNIKSGPISGKVSDNSIIYRIFGNVESGCSLMPRQKGRLQDIKDLTEYLEAKDILFLEPKSGKIVIFDPARNLIVFMEG